MINEFLPVNYIEYATQCDFQQNKMRDNILCNLFYLLYSRFARALPNHKIRIAQNKCTVSYIFLLARL